MTKQENNPEKSVSVTDDSDILQLVSFKIGDEEFGVDILRVQEINRMTDITRVPNSPEFVEGVINLRGKVIPIIDLRKRFGLGVTEHTNQTRIVVVEIDDQVIGFIVDAVSEVLRVPTKTIEPPPPIVAGIESEYIRGVAKLEDRLLILLDLQKVITVQEKEKLSELNVLQE